MINLHNCDCTRFMNGKIDGFYDLAIVDPPYGLDKSSLTGSGKLKNRAVQSDTSWDIAPDEEYFKELFRVSKNQIIWGGNYFALPRCRCFVVWDKCQPWENFSACEYAWTSFDCPAKMFKFDNRVKGKIHPTQKPVKLYEYLLEKFANDGDKILDTHGGSMSIAIACHNLGFYLDLCEVNKDYFSSGKSRLEEHQKQLLLF